METIRVRLEKLFRAEFGDGPISVTRSTSADDEDGWNRITHLRLIVAVEKEFGMQFAAEEIGRLKDVGELIDLIASKTAKKAS